MLTQKRLKELFSYNSETGQFTRIKALCGPVAKIGMIAGTLGGRGYIDIGIDGKRYKAHRLAWLYIYGEFPSNKLQIDHIDGSRTNNNIANLRIVTASQNLQNIKSAKSHNITSKILGVSWYKRDKKWQVEISINKKKLYLGRYSNLEEAKSVYLSAKKLYHISQI
jgi:hypothetical protein